jgi:type I restriction enzyme M protein
MPKPKRRSKQPTGAAAKAAAPTAASPVDAIAGRLKAGREQHEVVGPLVEVLLEYGWDLAQMRFGHDEWYVPKSPSQATRREKGQSFDGFPVDIALFDSPKRTGDPEHVLFIVETKTPDEDAGVTQLEAYLQSEPRAKLGAWTNTPVPSAPAVFVFREQSGKLVRRRRPLTNLPRPGEAISSKQKRLRFEDLAVPSQEVLRRTVEDLLDHVVAGDPFVNRREDQLDQLCGVLLLKLHSDKHAKMRPAEPPAFRPLESVARTAEETRKNYSHLVQLYRDTFLAPQDQELRFADATIFECVERLAHYRLIDVGINTISLAFQVLRTAALKQGEGQYFTPQPVIDAGVRLMQLDLEDIVIDPACGTGGFLVGVLLEMQRRYPGHEAELARWAQTNIFGIDKDSIGVKLSKAVMQIAGDGSAHVVRGDSIRTHLWAKDFPHLLDPAFENGRYSAVITNPPFGAGLTVGANDARLAGLDIAERAAGRYEDLEIGLHFLQRAHQLLGVGGKLGIILPETYFFSPTYAWLFDWLKRRFEPRVVANVPMEAFMGFCRAKTNFYVFEKIG